MMKEYLREVAVLYPVVRQSVDSILRLREEVSTLPTAPFFEPVSLVEVRDGKRRLAVTSAALLNAWCQHAAYGSRVRLWSIEEGVVSELAASRLLGAMVLTRAHMEAAAQAAYCEELLVDAANAGGWDRLDDIFVRIANRIAAERSDVLFVVVGSDRVAYGNDLRHIKTKTFREHVLATEKPDRSRFRFLGAVPPEELAAIFSLSDLHVYLTVPFVLSWSLLNALACECVVLASDTPPVREVISHGRNGLVAPFLDVDALANQALRVLERPTDYRSLAAAGRALVEGSYSLDITLPRLRVLFDRLLQRTTKK